MWRDDDDDDDFDGGLPELLLRVLSVLRRTDGRTGQRTPAQRRRVGKSAYSDRPRELSFDVGNLVGCLVRWLVRYDNRVS